MADLNGGLSSYLVFLNAAIAFIASLMEAIIEACENLPCSIKANANGQVKVSLLIYLMKIFESTTDVLPLQLFYITLKIMP
ncbi:MAG: hypothetical protein BMS9Abin36_0964 [Gammaproteobacteria bacterium]|nr:MAG: hypothetical protein BMS9Abin36_0964 [Gammaproteobacteria bacterium]